MIHITSDEIDGKGVVNTGFANERSEVVEFQWFRLDVRPKNQMDDSAAEFENTIRGQNPDRCKSESLEHCDRCHIDRPQIDRVQYDHCCIADQRTDHRFLNHEIGQYEKTQTDRLE